MRKKRFLAVVLSMAMVTGNAVVASATVTPDTYNGGISFNATGAAAENAQVNQTVTGTGYLTDKVEDRIFRVVVPTQRVTGDPDLFDFILDPQELIDQTAAKKYIKGAKIDGSSGNKMVSVNSYKKSSLYFVNSANGVKSLTDTSDELSIINKSTMDVDVSVNAKVTPAGGISVSTDKTFAGNKSASMYLGFVRTSPSAKDEAAISDNDAEYIDQATLGNAKSFYKVSANDDGTVTYDIPSQNASGVSESQNAYATYKFKLTGTTNTKGDWGSVNAGTGPAVQITYHLMPHPENAKATYKVTAGRGVSITLSNATGVSRVTFTGGDGNEATLPTDKYKFTADTGIFVFTSDLCTTLANASGFTSRDYVIHLAGGGTVEVTLTK